MRLPARVLRFAVVLLAILVAGAVAPGCSRTPGDLALEPSKTVRAPEHPQDPTAGRNVRPCDSCHQEPSRFLAYGGHARLSCATCHGIRVDHIQAKVQPRRPENRHCLGCHTLVTGPGGTTMSEKDVLEHHVRFVEAKHVIRVDRNKVGTRCIGCHDPHLGQ